MPRSFLFFSSVPLWSVHPEIFSVARRARREKARLTVLTCGGGLSVCAANPSHSDTECKMCMSLSDRQNAVLKSILRNGSFRTVQILQSAPPKEIGLVGSRADLMDFHHDGAPLGALVASQLADDLKDACFELDTDRNLIRANSALRSGIELYEQTRRVLADGDFSEVYTWNGRRPSDGPVWWAARRENVRAFSVISHPDIRRTIRLEAPSVQDYEQLRCDFEEWKSSKSSLGERWAEVRGHHLVMRKYRRNQKTFGPRKRLDPRLPEKDMSVPVVTVFVSSPAEFLHISNIRMSFFPRPYRWVEEVTEALASELPDARVIVQWHPNLKACRGQEKADIREVIARTPRALHFPPEDTVDALTLLRRSSLVVSVGSTLGTLAAATRVPTLEVGPMGIFHPDSTYHAKITRVREDIAIVLAKGLPKSKSPKEARLWTFYNERVARTRDRQSFVIQGVVHASAQLSALRKRWSAR